MTIPPISSPADDAFKRWFKRQYDRHPRLTILATLLVFASLIAVLFWAQFRDQQIAEARRRQILDYETQLSELSKVETSLRNLTEFVRTQKARLKDSEDLIAALKTEQQRLTPFVEADRRVVKAVLELQQQQAQAGVTRERWIGFGMGILASTVASFLYGIVGSFLRKRRATNAQTAGAKLSPPT